MLLIFIGNFTDFSVFVYFRAFLEHFIRSTFCILNDPVVFCIFMKGCHHLSSAVKRNLAYPRQVFLHIALFQPQLVCIVNKSALRRLSCCAVFAFLYLGITAESHGLSQQLFVISVIVNYGHLVLSKGSRLIGTYYLCTPQGFNCSELSDNGIPL